ncbi:hypothetical protein ABVF61_08025 [Roseibium sp. HPY-6]|uniref:hypothetical protein n=1 Tax=Roseibium sp. HPY-6 TaxID=3229852 RepID=UPI00338FB2A0
MFRFAVFTVNTIFLFCLRSEAHASGDTLKEFCFARSLTQSEETSYAILRLDVSPDALDYESVGLHDCNIKSEKIFRSDFSIKFTELEETQTKIAFVKFISLISGKVKLVFSVGFAQSYFWDPISDYYNQGKRVCGVEAVPDTNGLYKKNQSEKIGCSAAIDTYYGNIEDSNNFLTIGCPKHSKSCVYTIFYNNWEVWVSGIPKEELSRWQEVRLSLLSELTSSFNPRNKILTCDGLNCR